MSQPKGPLQLLGHWLYMLLFIGGRCICPKCRQGAMFKSFYGVHERCPHCGVKLQPYAGDSLGVIATGYILTLLPAIVVTLAAWKLFHPGGYPLLAVFGVVSAAILFGCYRNMKGIWIALVYLMTGFERSGKGF